MEIQDQNYEENKIPGGIEDQPIPGDPSETSYIGDDDGDLDDAEVADLDDDIDDDDDLEDDDADFASEDDVILGSDGDATPTTANSLDEDDELDDDDLVDDDLVNDDFDDDDDDLL
jgi:hypothetical protein